MSSNTTDIDNTKSSGIKTAQVLDILKTVVLPLALVFLTEPLYREPLYNESLKLAPEMQKYDSWKPVM